MRTLDIGRTIWVWWLSKEIDSQILSFGTWLRGTSVQIILTPRSTVIAHVAGFWWLGTLPLAVVLTFYAADHRIFLSWFC